MKRASKPRAIMTSMDLNFSRRGFLKHTSALGVAAAATFMPTRFAIGQKAKVKVGLGLADTFGKVMVPEAAGMVVYALMAVVLLWRPRGLFGAGAA